MTRLEGRRVFVTGAARGIGRAIASTATQCGAAVAVVDLDLDAAAIVADEIADQGGTAVPIAADITVLDDCEIAIGRAAGALGGLDGLVNNAGVLFEQSIGEITEKAWSSTLAVNLTAPWRLTQMVLPWFERSGGGSIVNISSIEGLRVRPTHAAYAAAKGGLLQLTRTSAIELGSRNIRVNAVCPGSIDTEMLRDHVNALDEPDAALDDLVGRNHLHRLGTPDEVAKVVVHLLSDDASFTSGHHYVVDGARIVGT